MTCCLPGRYRCESCEVELAINHHRRWQEGPCLILCRTLPLRGALLWSVEFKWHRVVWALCRCMNVAKALLGFCMTGALEAPSRSLDGTAEASPLVGWTGFLPPPVCVGQVEACSSTTGLDLIFAARGCSRLFGRLGRERTFADRRLRWPARDCVGFVVPLELRVAGVGPAARSVVFRAKAGRRCRCASEPAHWLPEGEVEGKGRRDRSYRGAAPTPA